MKTIGLLSDTHNHLDEKFFEFFSNCDEIWHAGDIGSVALADKLASFKPLRAVSGNIDDYSTRLQYPESLRFTIENTDVLINHIGGYPGKYSPSVKQIFAQNPPDLFVCGHSHILRVIYDKKFNCLTLNPGAAGQYGAQAVRTALRFKLDAGNIEDLEIFELER